jgi:CMP-N-acetylneuraminic acid synthetase
LVSTDNEEILEIARALGVLAPWLRPSELSSDVASSVDVALHALDYYESAFGGVDGVLLLQPTSPFRRAKTIRSVVDSFCNGHEAVVCVSPASAHPDWCLKIRGDRTEPFNTGDGLKKRSQDLEPAYVVNGSCYLISPDLLRAKRSFSPVGSSAVIVEDEVEAIDIDTEWDWLCAEKALEAGLVDSGWA